MEVDQSYKSEALEKREARNSKGPMTSIASQRSEAQKPYDDVMNVPKCCGLCNKGKCLQISNLVVLGVDVLQSIAATWLIFIFILGDSSQHFNGAFNQDTSAGVKQKAEINFMLIMAPIILNLYYKTYVGIRWVILKYSRPSLQTYYRVSWAYYTSYVIQGSFILAFAWHMFNTKLRALLTCSLVVCFPVWFMMTLYMQWADQQHKSMNQIRKNAINEKLSAQQQLEEDKLLIQRYSTQTSFNQSKESAITSQQTVINRQTTNSVSVPPLPITGRPGHNSPLNNSNSMSNNALPRTSTFEDRQLRLQAEIANYDNAIFEQDETSTLSDLASRDTVMK